MYFVFYLPRLLSRYAIFILASAAFLFELVGALIIICCRCLVASSVSILDFRTQLSCCCRREHVLFDNASWHCSVEHFWWAGHTRNIPFVTSTIRKSWVQLSLNTLRSSVLLFFAEVAVVCCIHRVSDSSTWLTCGQLLWVILIILLNLP